MTGGRYADIDRRARQERFTGGEIHHFAIARRIGAADPDSEDRRVNRAPHSFLGRGRVPAVRQHDHPRHRTCLAGARRITRGRRRVTFRQVGDCAAQVAAACGGRQAIDIRGGCERITEGQEFQSIFLAQLRLQIADDRLRALQTRSPIDIQQPHCSWKYRPAPAARCFSRPRAAPSRSAATESRSTG